MQSAPQKVTTPASSPAGALELPTVSIVIPTFNEARVIERCLRAVRAQAYPAGHFDVTVVDNGSTDGTVEIAERLADRVLRLPQHRVGALRNRGVEATSAAVLAFLDADCIPDPDWLAKGVAALLTEPCITGATYRVPEDAGWLERAWFSQEPAGRRRVTHINAGNLFVKRVHFDALGGFDESLVTGEDYEFAQRASRVVSIVSDDSIGVVHLGNPKTIRRFVSREIWHGLGALSSVRHDWRDKPFWATVAFTAGAIVSLVGFVLIPSTGPRVFLGGLIVVGGVVSLTLLYRFSTGTRLRLAVPLAVLYVLYYFGRSIALLRVAAGRTTYRRTK